MTRCRLIVLLSGLVFILTGCQSGPSLKSNIGLMTGYRDGDHRVEGVAIHVWPGGFTDPLDAGIVRVTESTTGNDITELMEIKVYSGGGSLYITFKSQASDFVEGGRVTVRVAKEGFANVDHPTDMAWSIDTDFEPEPPLDVWGPGVADPAALGRELEQLLAYVDYRNGVYMKQEDWDDAYQKVKAMTWEQAASVYRQASPSVRQVMCNDLISGQAERFRGMNRAQVLALLGEPDDYNPADRAGTLAYSGYGYVSDSTGALWIVFDDQGRFIYIGYPG